MLPFALQILNVDIPYPEYLVPLSIGAGVGFMFLLVTWNWGKPVPPPPLEKAQNHKEYDPFTEGSPTEQRKGFRRGGNLVEVFLALPDQKNNPHRGWVFDRSVGGVGLVCACEIAPETVVCLLPVNAPKTIPWVDVEVRSCRPTDEGFELGCKFVKSPPWTILLMFG